MTLELQWVTRDPPLVPEAILGRGETAHALASRVIDMMVDSQDAITGIRSDPAERAAIRAAAGDGWLVVLAPTDQLPWVEGAVYLGWDSGLLLPTLLCPTVPTFMLARAVGRSLSDADRLRIVLADQILCGPLPERPIDMPALRRLIGVGP